MTQLLERIGTMIRAWLTETLDARRSFSLLIEVAGYLVAAIGMAASPEPWAFNSGGVVWFGPVLGVAAGTYIRRRMSGDARALLWALALGASVAALVVAMFGTAGVIRPTVLGMSGLGDVWSGLLMSGFITMFVGALIWERDAHRRRLTALLLLVLWLMVGGVFATAGGGPSAPVGLLILAGGVGALLVAFAVSRPAPQPGAATPIASWR